MMSASTTKPAVVVRTQRGLTIAGTRITLYDVMDYLTAGWPAELIRDRLNLSGEQIDAVMAYVQEHRAEVGAEYQRVLQAAAENRQYWEERNRERFERVRTSPPAAGQENLREKLNAWKERLERPE